MCIISTHMVAIENLHSSIDVLHLEQQAEQVLEQGRRLVKFGIAVIVLDDTDRMLVLEHEARDNEFQQGALGASMETYRYISGTISTAESPMQAWQRSLKEELGLDEDGFTDAGLFIAEDSVFNTGEFIFGKDSAGFENFAVCNGLIVRTSNPGAFLGLGRTEEILRADFIKIDELLRTNSSELRPGFKGWLEFMLVSFDGLKSKKPLIHIEPIPLPLTGRDIRFDHIKDRNN